ncbi:hypothetical protein A3D77_04025 [Candidatus Gottesmanbacteria bacterium RIFCSPHIGHO2_02_FULL_39_11]|uniref:Uncharacterized protein n=1 Tax=Candidatus Gottesmanbacteria bacterium RIFCSPHIGHO2_02_FULL_39_11 TaxID=1798382 RepID=A0A1F5ZJI0_9BACT|nr:MAG: hypothetical protein A3D77_04025 [Candidatus Gottesmanbacteria bacterium RIFCSPHIGHO2_02_FULL_39_11]
MKKIYYMGNPLVRIDRKPTEIIPSIINKFKNIQFIYADPTENIDLINKTLVILDTVVGINKVTLFSDLNSFVRSPRFSVHDYDLLSDASILFKLRKIKKLEIIGIPPQGNMSILIEDIAGIINSLGR